MSKVTFGKTQTTTKAPTTVVAAEPMPAIAGVDSVTGAGPAPSPALPVAVSTPAPASVPAPYVPPATEEVNRREFSDTALDIGSVELRLPTLNIVQGIGDLSQVFIAGAVVIDKTLELLPSPKALKPADPKPTLNLHIVGSRPQTWVEKPAQYNPSVMPRRFDTEREVVAAGGTTDYARSKRDGLALFEQLVTLMALVEKPADVEDISQFPIAITKEDGKVGAFAPVTIHLRGMQYRAGFVQLSTARRAGTGIDLRRGYHTRTIKARTEFKQAGPGGAFIWVFSDGGPSDKEIVAEAFALLGRPSPYGNIAQSQRDPIVVG